MTVNRTTSPGWKPAALNVKTPPRVADAGVTVSVAAGAGGAVGAAGDDEDVTEDALLPPPHAAKTTHKSAAPMSFIPGGCFNGTTVTNAATSMSDLGEVLSMLLLRGFRSAEGLGLHPSLLNALQQRSLWPRNPERSWGRVGTGRYATEVQVEEIANEPLHSRVRRSPRTSGEGAHKSLCRGIEYCGA